VTPPTCTPFNITNIGRALKDLKRSLKLNYGIPNDYISYCDIDLIFIKATKK